MNAAGQTEWITWPFVIGLLCAVAAGWFVARWIKISATLDHDLPLLTDAGRWCEERGHHLWHQVPGMDVMICGQCQAEHVHEPIASCGLWVCRCGWNRRRHTELYRDERNAS